MHNNFWRGLVCGSIIGIALGAALQPQRKPLLEQGRDALTDTTRDFIGQAKRAQRRFMNRIS